MKSQLDITAEGGVIRTMTMVESGHPTGAVDSFSEQKLSKKPTLLQKFLKAYGNKTPPVWRAFLTELLKKQEPAWSKDLKKFSSDPKKKVKAFSKKKIQTKKR